MTTEQEKKEFAKEQAKFLKEKGIRDPVHIGRIFKIAGPGQIQNAYNIATCEDWSTTDGKIRKDLLDCLLSGFAYVNWGKHRMEKVLKSLGFLVPETKSTYSFEKMLHGALEILIPNSGDLDEDEMKEIHEKIQRSFAGREVSKHKDEVEQKKNE